jgi:hypothetical protein
MFELGIIILACLIVFAYMSACAEQARAKKRIEAEIAVERQRRSLIKLQEELFMFERAQCPPKKYKIIDAVKEGRRPLIDYNPGDYYIGSAFFPEGGGRIDVHRVVNGSYTLHSNFLKPEDLAELPKLSVLIEEINSKGFGKNSKCKKVRDKIKKLECEIAQLKKEIE